MAIAASHYAYKPMALPKTCDADRLQGFGIQVEGFDPDALTPEKGQELYDQLLRVSCPALGPRHWLTGCSTRCWYSKMPR